MQGETNGPKRRHTPRFVYMYTMSTCSVVYIKLSCCCLSTVSSYEELLYESSEEEEEEREGRMKKKVVKCSVDVSLEKNALDSQSFLTRSQVPAPSLSGPAASQRCAPLVAHGLGREAERSL